MINSFEKEIWVYGDLRSERLFGLCLNVLAKGHELARSVSGKIAVVMMGSENTSGTEDSSVLRNAVTLSHASKACIDHGADFVYVLDNEKLAVPRSDIYGKALNEAVRQGKPMLVLLALTDFTREVASRVARMNNAGLIAECADIRIEDQGIVASCPSWGGQIMADITFTSPEETGFATVQAHAFQALEAQGDPGTVKAIEVDSRSLPEEAELLARSSEPTEKHSLEEAPVVVVGGAGLGNGENFGLVRALASALGGEVGATRPPVLHHWVDEEKLIGQTGKTIRPDLLITVGTSGAIQYTAGIMEAKTIIAVNRDKNAPIFQISDYGVVADGKGFLPLFTSKVRQKAMRSLADALAEEEKEGIGESFGTKVRKMRESQDWTLESLAEATGESADFLDKVERDEMTPPVGFLLRLAGALKIDPSTFLRTEEKTLLRDIREQAFVKRTKDYSYKTLSPGAESDHLRAFMITIEPKQIHKPVAYKHEGEEFVFVMEGELQLTIGNKTHHLKREESFHFNSNTPHKLKSMSDEPTRCIVVLYTP